MKAPASSHLLKHIKMTAALCMAVVGSFVAATAHAEDKRAWTQAGVSSGMHSLDQAATVTYKASVAVPPGATITRVYADRDYAGQAHVQTSLCWNGVSRCVDIVGRGLTTAAFKGLDATQPMYLVHRARSWRGTRPPLYVKGNVTVWYEVKK